MQYDGYTTNRAILPATDCDGMRGPHIRPAHWCYTYKVLDATKRRCVAELRLYATDGSHTAALWVHATPKRNLVRGSGRASGYGYHRASAAAEMAIEAAGIKLEAHFGGKGDRAINTALEAIGRACGLRKPWIVEAWA
jgi:hypothetical protein